MDLKTVERGEVPAEALACMVAGHSHLRYPLPNGDWLVVAAPTTRSMQHARAALAPIDAGLMMDVLEQPDETRLSALGIRSDVKCFQVSVATLPEIMSEEAAESAKIQFAPEKIAPTATATAAAEPVEMDSRTAGGEDAEDALEEEDLPEE